MDHWIGKTFSRLIRSLRNIVNCNNLCTCIVITSQLYLLAYQLLMVNVCYQELRKQDKSGISNWCSYIRKILSAANSCSYWVLRDKMTRSTLSVIKSNLEKVHINKCMESIINAGPGNKLRTYKLIKKRLWFREIPGISHKPKTQNFISKTEIELSPTGDRNGQTCKATPGG